MLAGELFVALGKNIFFYIVLWRRGHGPLRFLASNLDEQALLQGAGAQTGGVEVLYNLQYFFQLFGRSVDTGVDGEFVADTVQRFAQQAIVVQRADEIFGPVRAGAESSPARRAAGARFHRRRWRRRKEFLLPAPLCCGCSPAACSRGYRLRSDNRLRIIASVSTIF